MKLWFAGEALKSIGFDNMDFIILKEEDDGEGDYDYLIDLFGNRQMRLKEMIE